MAIILKPNRTFTDARGVIHSSAYGVIDICMTNKRKGLHTLVLSIYVSADAISSGKSPLYNVEIRPPVDSFNTYFSPAAITADDNQFKQSYIYLLTLPEWSADWQSDE